MAQEASYSNLVFSFGHPAVKNKGILTDREKTNKFKGRDYQRLLNKVNARSEKVEKMRINNPHRARAVEMDIKWERTIQKAAGELVKDNVELLRKGLAKKIKGKQKSKTGWENRKRREAEQQERRQLKRRENLAKRKEDKRKHQIRRIKKKRSGN